MKAWILVPLALAACRRPADVALPPERAPAGLVHELPSAVDLRPRFVELGLAPRAQGGRPTCSIFTATEALEFACSRASNRGVRLSVEYVNWAANAATGRNDDGDFFHNALTGFERFGACSEALLPYAGEFDASRTPPTEALVAGGRLLGELAARLRVRWILPWQEGRSGLTDAQFEDARRTLAAGWPIAAGSSHSRLLVGYADDAAKPGGGAFLTLDSAVGGWSEVDYSFVKTRVNDAFVVEFAP